MDIKIFVSHRIDVNSICIKNPIYVPVKCGAVFGTNNENYFGDDTGDNISDLREYLNEFTVQYWAWKNVEADYYGLCHYRRYLSFSDKHFRRDSSGLVHSFMLTKKMQNKYELLNIEKQKRLIYNYDALLPQGAPVCKIVTPKGKVKTVREMWDAFDGYYFEKEIINETLKLIDKLSPDYSNSASEYFAGNKHVGYNCYVLKKDLFFQLCEFQFPILFRLLDQIDLLKYSDNRKRSVAYIGEILFGIFSYHIMNKLRCNYNELQLVYFAQSEKIMSKYSLWCKKLAYFTKRAILNIISPIFPPGTKRREWLKNIYHKRYK